MKTFLLTAVSAAVLLVVALALPAGATPGRITNFSSGQTSACTLDGGNPSGCDATITSGAKCTASLEGTTAAVAAYGVAVSYPLLADAGVSTLVRMTSADGATAVARALCNK